jgi:hypothetical protein
MRVGRDNGIGRWTVIEIHADVHVVPLADTRMHTYPQGCWCGPKTERHEHGHMYTHRALDGRP